MLRSQNEDTTNYRILILQFNIYVQMTVIFIINNKVMLENEKLLRRSIHRGMLFRFTY